MNNRTTGILSVFFAAIFFGLMTPLCKILLSNINPVLLAGLCYLGSGIGLFLFRFIRRLNKVTLTSKEYFWLGWSILMGGIIAPVLLMYGLSHLVASDAALLMNLEVVLTALIAWFIFKESVNWRVALGMVFIVGGSFVLSWQKDLKFLDWWPSLAILGACLTWGLDNNFTRKIAHADAVWISAIKGLVAGSFNLLLALLINTKWPSTEYITMALVVGFFAYGVSLVFFVIGLRHLGAARTAAYFSTAPFVGAIAAIFLLHDPINTQLIIAGVLMAIGVGLYLTEKRMSTRK